MSYKKKLPESFPYHVDLPTNVQVALTVGWILAEGTAFAVTPNIWNRTYRLWMSEPSYKVVARKLAQEDRP
jgi:hypothetical protein